MDLKTIARLILDFTRKSLFGNKNDRELYLLKGNADDIKIKEIERRLLYFAPKLKINTTDKLSGLQKLDLSLIGFADTSNNVGFKLKNKEIFDFDFDKNYLDGWAYHDLLSRINSEWLKNEIKASKLKYETHIKKLSGEYKKAYIFGTGPSLEKAIERDWTDGIRIVSNTIVKDPELWNHINPQIITAGDGIYHFGDNKFAKNFREDLKGRLKTGETLFMYPARFHAFCSKEFAEFKNRLVPVPIGNNQILHYGLNKDFSLPIFGNVLLLLLLPLACSLSKNIFLWGFDGRAPSDKLFWKNSNKHFYADFVPQLIELHPAFFDKLVPKDSPESYVKSVHGDALDHLLTLAEKDGFHFKMMHHSFTETLSKRS